MCEDAESVLNQDKAEEELGRTLTSVETATEAHMGKCFSL